MRSFCHLKDKIGKRNILEQNVVWYFTHVTTLLSPGGKKSNNQQKRKRYSLPTGISVSMWRRVRITKTPIFTVSIMWKHRFLLALSLIIIFTSEINFLSCYLLNALTLFFCLGQSMVFCTTIQRGNKSVIELVLAMTSWLRSRRAQNTVNVLSFKGNQLWRFDAWKWIIQIELF